MKRFFCVIAAVFIAISMCGCSDDGLDAVFACDISENPKTLDPQQADDTNSAQIVMNVYMGLMRYDTDGAVVCGAAESYTKSADGLTYNFKLRNDISWINCGDFEQQCTAKDFVFGFRRLFSSGTKAPRAGEYFCIRNSEELYNGRKISEERFGVRAVSDFELEITLTHEEPRFLQLLCEPPAMPCNEEFFNNSRGKYGLSAECTASNGAFYVRQWHFDPYASTDVNNVILSRNYKNAEAYGVCPYTVKFFIEDEEDFIGDFLSGETNIIAVANEDKTQINGNFACEEFASITVGLTFNEKYPLFANADFRKALALAIPRERISEAMKEFKPASGIVPDRTTLNGKNYRENAGECKLFEYDANEAEARFKSAKTAVNTELLRGARIITQSADAYSAAQYIAQEWQRFGFYCQIELLSETDYISRISSGTYEIAVTELAGGYDSPSAYLEQLSTAFLEDNVSELLNTAYLSDDGFEIYRTAEQIFINNASFIPLYGKNQYFFTDKDISDVIYNPFTNTIDFSHGKMK